MMSEKQGEMKEHDGLPTIQRLWSLLQFEELDIRTVWQQLLQPKQKLHFIISMKYGRGGIFYQKIEKCEHAEYLQPEK